jgi:hypothetical protein
LNPFCIPNSFCRGLVWTWRICLTAARSRTEGIILLYCWFSRCSL